MQQNQCREARQLERGVRMQDCALRCVRTEATKGIRSGTRNETNELKTKGKKIQAYQYNQTEQNEIPANLEQCEFKGDMTTKVRPNTLTALTIARHGEQMAKCDHKAKCKSRKR